MPVTQIIVAGPPSSTAGQLILLGVTLAAALSFDRQIKNVFKALFVYIHSQYHTWPSLTEERANCVVCSCIQSHLGYANPLHTSMSSTNFDKLQQIQNTLACTVTLLKKKDTILHHNC